MFWKTRGTARREARGEKKVTRYLTFELPEDDRVGGEIEGTFHKSKDCEDINPISIHRYSYVKKLVDFEDKFNEPNFVVNHKIGRGAWVQVRVIRRCPICFGGNS